MDFLQSFKAYVNPIWCLVLQSKKQNWNILMDIMKFEKHLGTKTYIERKEFDIWIYSLSPA